MAFPFLSVSSRTLIYHAAEYLLPIFGYTRYFFDKNILYSHSVSIMKYYLIICTSLILVTSLLAAEDESDSLATPLNLQELEEIQQEIEQIEKDIRTIEQLLHSVQKEKDAQESTIIQLENQKKNLEERLNRLYEEKATKENELEWVDALIMQMEADIYYNRSLLTTVVQNLGNLYIFYTYGDGDSQKKVDMQNFYLCTSALLHNIDSLFHTWSMAIQNRHLAAQNIEQITSQLQRTKYTYSNVTEQYKTMEEEIEFLAKVEQDYQMEAEELIMHRESLEDFIKQREASKRGRVYTFEFSDSLISPIRGEILHRFGEVVADTEGFVRNQGIFIKAGKGTPVQCVAPGVVAFAGWFENRGNLVIIDHQNGFYSLYGYNDKLLIHKGMRVDRGQIIAYSGKSPVIDESGLYFELRKAGKPVNPQDYLPNPEGPATNKN